MNTMMMTVNDYINRNHETTDDIVYSDEGNFMNKPDNAFNMIF